MEKSEGVKEGWKGDGEAPGEKRKGSRRRNIGSVERALLEEESAKERNERGTKERADQRAA